MNPAQFSRFYSGKPKRRSPAKRRAVRKSRRATRQSFTVKRRAHKTSGMSYYMDPVSVYPAPHPSDRLDLMRQNGGMDVAPQTSVIGTCQSQHHYTPRPVFLPEVTLQEVPNGPEFCPPGEGAGAANSGRGSVCSWQWAWLYVLCCLDGLWNCLH
ncbi:hypothetical protein SKAU_G00088840 [Synaphobranchus kaupii]|uniref:Uncharacterized protein n=1 Tax=Synaphobranchus kaupii TaxID=118154 RepID=A0A9Q1FX66_SYNKA|nr:hypothetical protein SKAU_G00088840 [Synaphobranchus kaupii]